MVGQVTRKPTADHQDPVLLLDPSFVVLGFKNDAFRALGDAQAAARCEPQATANGQRHHQSPRGINGNC